MRTVGIIAEYNPFHKGHKYHIDETRWQTGCDYVIVIMSGAFTQRGEPALIDKWTRARMALAEGADIVIELPALFAVRSADWFAMGGVGLLSSLGIVDGISFGCETDDLPTLQFAADAFEAEPPQVVRGIKKNLKKGKSLARARGEVLAEYLNVDPSVLNAPNTALALEYMRANDRLLRPMRLFAVKRKGDYRSKELSEFASAGAIRLALHEGRREEALSCMPEKAALLLRDMEPTMYADPTGLDNLLLDRLRTMDKEELMGICDVTEGLEDRILRCAEAAPTRSDLLKALKCKRYTMARLSRICTGALLSIDKDLASTYPSPPYARLLGFRESARPLLREISENAQIPLVSNVKGILDHPCFQLERRATDLWALCTKHPQTRRARRDFTERMIVVKEEE